MIKEINTKKILCDFCTYDKKARYVCSFCKKDICTKHRYYIAFIEKIKSYTYKQKISHNLCPECNHKIINKEKMLKKLNKDFSLKQEIKKEFEYEKQRDTEDYND